MRRCARTGRGTRRSGGASVGYHADIQNLNIGELPVLVGSVLCHSPIQHQPNTSSCFFIVNGQTKVIISQERLIHNHPLVSSCLLQSKQTQYTCEVRSIPASNPNRFPVIFALVRSGPCARAGRPVHKVTVPLPPTTVTIADPIIVNLTYFRNEVPVLLLFYAFGVVDLDEIGRLIQRTSTWASVETLVRLLYPTTQHTQAVRSQEESLKVLMRSMLQTGRTDPQNASAPKHDSSCERCLSVATEDLLHANVLPHLADVASKVQYLAFMVGVLLNHMFHPPSRISQYYDKDHMGNKRVDTCGVLLARLRRSLSIKKNKKMIFEHTTDPQRPLPDARLCGTECGEIDDVQIHHGDGGA